jgi:hypothetical protein
LIGFCQSVDNCRLFVGGISKTKEREEILDEMCKVTEGVVDVIAYRSNGGGAWRLMRPEPHLKLSQQGSASPILGLNSFLITTI